MLGLFVHILCDKEFICTEGGGHGDLRVRPGLTRDQDLAAQDAELAAAGAPRCSRRKRAVPKTDRPELAKVIRRFEPGDVLMVVRLDRLARSRRNLLNVLDEIGKRGAGFRSLRDAWADTTTPHGLLDAHGAWWSRRV